MADPIPAWTFIPVASFSAPSPPVTDAARGKLRQLWRSLRQILRQQPASTTKPPRWDRPSPECMGSAVPAIDWEQLIKPLEKELGFGWFENPRPARRIHPFLAPPGCDLAGGLRSLAGHRKLRVLESPSTPELLETSDSTPAWQHGIDQASEEVLVIPELERWFLRHGTGLVTVRLLLERLVLSRRRVLIGCHSWAWAFLDRSLGVEQVLGPPRTLAPLDAERLDAWFRARLDLEHYEFRHSRDDEPVFEALPAADSGDPPPPQREVPPIFESLAARARGNPAVALQLWRACLRSRNANDESCPPSSGARTVLWVVSPTELTTPELPTKLGRIHRFVLHSILLHGGLSHSSLIGLMPFGRDDIQVCVRSLLRWEILEEQEDRLHVSAVAYPLVKDDLQNEGFLTDSL